MSAEEVIFEVVREGALAELQRAFRADDGYQRFCEWQDAHEPHIAVYCNSLSHAEALEDLLEHGTWCDDIRIVEGFSEDDVRLFRFYTVAFLVLEACLCDLREITRAVTKGARLPSDAAALMGFINNIWKHRAGEQGQRPAFHKTHHHGPYLFADCPGFEAALPEDGAYLSVDHQPSEVNQPLPLVVPSLHVAMSAFGGAVAHVGKQLDGEQARHSIEAAWGDAEFAKARPESGNRVSEA